MAVQNGGRPNDFGNKGNQTIEAQNKQGKSKKPVVMTGSDLRSGKGK